MLQDQRAVNPHQLGAVVLSILNATEQRARSLQQQLISIAERSNHVHQLTIREQPVSDKAHL